MAPSSMLNSQELTAEEVLPFLIQPLEAASTVLRAGPRIFDSPTGDPLRIPKLVDIPDPTFKAENELIDEKDPDWSELVLLPTILKSVKVIHRFSNELARHSVISIASTLQAALVREVAAVLDTNFLKGLGTVDGNGNRGPIGLTEQADIQTGAWDATGATMVTVGNDAIGMLLAAEITDLSKVVWFISGADYTALSKVTDGDNRPLIQPDVKRGTGFELLGIPIYVTNKLDTGTAMLVDMNMVAVGRDLAPSVKILDQTWGQYDQLAIRVVARMDIGLLQPEGVVLLTDAP